MNAENKTDDQSDDYVYSTDEERFFDFSDVMDTLNENHEPGDKVKIFRARRKEYEHKDFISAYRVIDDMQSSAYDEMGEFAEDYLYGITKEQETDLENHIAQWFDKNSSITFHGVTDVEEIEVTAGDDNEPI